MKAFSKEWWLELSRYLERDKCWIWRDEPAYFKKLEKYNDDYIEQIIDYCFKRYAEAYHLEQMEGYDLDCAMIAERNERERILGIIEEEQERHRQLKMKSKGLGRQRDKHKFREFALRDLTQKIKGE